MRFPASPLPAVIAMGLAGQLGQILVLRELLTVFHGSELTIGIILAAWLVWVGIGSRWAHLFVERSRRPEQLLVAIAGSVFVLMPATLVLIRALRGFFNVLPGAHLSFLDTVVACFLVLAPLCLLLGAQFVLLARLWREYEGAFDTHAAGKAYMAEAAGTILAGILFTFLLVHHANPFQTALFGGWILLAAAVAAVFNRPGHPVSPLALTAAVAALLGSLLAGPLLADLDAWAHRLHWRAFAPDHPLVASHASKYGHIAIAYREDQYSFFQSGHLLFSTAAPDTDAPAFEEQQAAIVAHFAMAQHRNPRRILLIGGGLRGTLREIARHPVERIDYVELDEALLRAAQPLLPRDTREALEDPRVRVHHLDGRLFITSSRTAYDLILVDVPDPTTAVLNRFYTVEFFREASARLASDGVLALGAVSTPDLRGSAIANRNATLYHTLRSVFPYVLPAGERFLFLFASRDPGQLSSDAATLRARHLERGVDTPAFAPGHFHLLLLDAPLRRINWVLRHHGRSSRAHLEPPHTPPLLPPSIEEQQRLEAGLPPPQRRTFINSDFRPIAYFYTLVFWNVLARADDSPAFQWLARVDSGWIVPPIAACLLAMLVLRHRRRRTGTPSDLRLGVRLAVFTTGLSTMSLQVALLFAFQSVYGFVYERVGLIVALFMAGLLLGTATTQRFIPDKSNVRVLAGVQLTIAIAASLIAVSLPAAARVPSAAAVFVLFSVLTFGAGVLNGFDFPLAAECCWALEGRAEKAVGTVYGIELFGACIGAVLASVVIAPVLGLVACGLLAGVANATAFVALWIARRPDERTSPGAR